jgi:hypothetical protein
MRANINLALDLAPTNCEPLLIIDPIDKARAHVFL